MGNVYFYGLTDFQAIATGAAVLASGCLLYTSDAADE